MSDVEVLRRSLAARYAVETEVGAGGMATVYRARDLKHDRQVAIKVLTPELGAVLGVERFLSEIKVTANLQHPNLLPLFDSGEADGLLYYVMPYVEGETLRHRIDREKQLPVDEAIRIATAVASALDYAHRHGVIHRDLKPENILLHDGQPLVADFGIALAVSNAGGNRVTQTGLSLGTPQYMSPEQATGDRVIDGRTDIYSLGAVTYEMLTGDPPHVGSTSQAVIARVLTEKPRSVCASRPNVPGYVDAAVERALEKLPADRFATPREFADALTGKIVLSPTVAGVSASASRTRREKTLMAALGTAAVLLAITTLIAIRRGPARVADAPLGRFEVATPRSEGLLQLSISPDGRTILFSGVSSAARRVIWSRPLDTTQATAMVATEGATSTFWSPDSRQIAFVADGQLKRVARTGGSAENICDFPGGARGGSWNANNVMIVSGGGDIYRVPVVGGVRSKLDLGKIRGSRWELPVFLPDGDHFLVLNRSDDPSSRGAYIASLDGGAPTRIVDVQAKVAFAPPNHLLFVRNSALYAQTLDWHAKRLSGEPLKIADDIGMNLVNGAAGFAVSETGVMVLRIASDQANKQLQWYSREGTIVEKVGEAANYNEIALSPDGKRIAAAVFTNLSERISNISVLETTTGISSQLTFDSAGVNNVVWAPDSRSVVFRTTALRSLSSTIRLKSVGGATDSTLYADTATRPHIVEDYSSDGKTLLLHRADTLLTLNLAGPKTPLVLGRLKGVNEVRFSPDGKQVSYSSSASGTGQIYVASFPALDNRRQLSANGGRQARWRGDGKEVYFLAPDGKVMVAVAKAGAGGEFNAPVALFQSPVSNPRQGVNQWDVGRDGQRFLFAGTFEEAESKIQLLTVLMNWTSMLPKQ